MIAMPPKPLPASIVRAYDIRGTTPDQIDESVAWRIGNAFGQWLLHNGGESAAVGRDARQSSPELYESAIDGLLNAGVDVHAAGLSPTPVIGWTVEQHGLGGGLIVTASHNPPEYNGFKLLAEEAQPLMPDDIVLVAATEPRAAPSAGRRTEFDAIEPYLEMIRSRFVNSTDIAVAIDPGNGTTSLTAARALIDAGARVHSIRSTARPTPEIAADPQNPDTMRALARTTRSVGAQLGIGWDGDGDRIGVLDHLGRRYEADWLVALLARPLLQRVPGAEVLLDLKTSTSAIESVVRHGGRPVSAKTGYSFFRRLMRDRQIAFGGETSGHIMFGPGYRPNEHAPWIDDGVYAACALLAYLSASGRTLAEEMAEIEPRPISPELRLGCPDELKANIAEAVGEWFVARHPQAQIDRSDGARVSLGDAWLHARASNTAPALSLRFEADDEAAYRRVAEQLQVALESHRSVAGIEQLNDAPTVGPQPLI